MPLTTKRALAESLKKLMNKRSFDKITVKDIVEDCGVNRQTFYYHFHDIYDLVEWIFEDAAETAVRDRLDYSDWTTGLETLMQFMQDNRVLILNAYHSINNEVVRRYIQNRLRPYCRAVAEHQAAGMSTPAPEEDLAFVTGVMTLAVTGLIMEWIGQQMKTTDATLRMVEKLRTAMTGTVQLMLRNLRERS